MAIAVVGSSPAVEAVDAALRDVDADVTPSGTDGIGDADLAVVVAVAGAATLERADRIARETGTPWLAVELGGVGGYPVVDAAVTGFGPETACYQCLRARVGSNVDPDEEPTAAPPGPVARLAGAVAGQAAASFAVGEPALFGTVREIPHAERSLLPVPGCECADGHDRSLDRSVVDRELEESLARAEQGLDERIGVVREVGEAESFPAPYYLTTLCETAGFSDVSAPSKAAGVDSDWNRALMKGLGEAVERYCAGVYRTESFERGTTESVAGAVDPSRFVGPDDRELAAERSWVEGEHLHSGDSAALPAELVTYPPADHDIRPPVTTGLGLGNGGVDALLSGLYEVIERDAAMLSWYSTFDPLALAVEDTAFEALCRRARSESLSVTPLLVTQDVDVPVVAVAVHRDKEWPKFALGSAADLDAVAAARSALAEALQNWMELRGMGWAEAADEDGAIGDYAGFPASVRSFVDVDGQVPASDVGPSEVPEGEGELDAVLERVADAGMDAYAAELTTRDVEALGFRAVRVSVPSAQPLFFDEPYFGERARSAPESLGFEPRLEKDHHPFP
jgi:ribosomal protein S12 methylthiotransferase accessory factor